MAAQQTSASNVNSSQPAQPQYPPVPLYSASGHPNTRVERITFQVWVILFLLVLVVSLVNYLLGWLR